MEQPQSLRSLFLSAKEKKSVLESRGDTNTTAYQDEVNATVAKFQECQRQISILSLFSSNETLEDVSSGDLQYMTLEYHLAELVQRGPSTDRESVLRRALGLYEKFLTRLDEYELLSKSDHKLFEGYMANPSAFTLAPINDAAARRDTKVRRFREEKELKQKLEVCQSLIQEMDLLYPEEATKILQYMARNEMSGESDSEATRNLYLSELQLYTHQTFQSLDLLVQEMSMLSAIRSAPPIEPTQDDPRQRSNLGGSNYTDRLDPSLSQLLGRGRGGPLLNSKGRPVQPFTLLDRRSQLQQGVFRSGHNLPTMTIEEYLAEEHRRGNVLQGGEQSGIMPEVDEDDLDKADEETMKARAWDEYVEANPRGSGNTLNRG